MSVVTCDEVFFDEVFVIKGDPVVRGCGVVVNGCIRLQCGGVACFGGDFESRKAGSLAAMESGTEALENFLKTFRGNDALEDMFLVLVVAGGFLFGSGVQMFGSECISIFFDEFKLCFGCVKL